jgi:heat shock protein HtpX
MQNNLFSLKKQANINIFKTWSLFFYFFIIVIGAGYIFSQYFGNSTILYFAVGLSILMSFFSYWFSDKLVLTMTKAKPLNKERYPEIHKMIVNLCQKANLPLPKLYIVDEEAPNAFATGRDYKNSVVAVTKGLIQVLDKKELEGVLAHELSHIKNRDMLVSTMAVVLAGFITILSDIFLRSLIWGSISRDDRNNAGGAVLILALVGAILAPIGATLMRLAVSRKREFLADSSGSIITGNPEGLASALEKISSHATPMKVANNASAHLWISDPFKGMKKKNLATNIHKLFLTHPPTKERVQILRNR